MTRISLWTIMVAAAAAACARGEDPLADTRLFSGDLLLLVDADMPAYAYADGRLDPRIEDVDAVHLIPSAPSPVLGPPAAAPNSVTHWPAAMAVASSGREVYVVEYAGGAPDGVEHADDVAEALGPGRLLTTLRLDDGVLAPVASLELVAAPTAVDVAADGRTLVVSTVDPEAALVFLAVEDGRTDIVHIASLSFPEGVGADQGLVTAARFSPDGAFVAVNLGSAGVDVLRVERDATGRVAAVRSTGARVIVGDLLSSLRWSNDGRFIYALDTGWGAGQLSRVFNGRGAVHVVSVDAAGGAAHVLQSEPAGFSPENFALCPQGDRLVTLNMERTYLPGGIPTGLFPRRDASSISLFAVSPDTGLLTRAGPDLSFRGVLPQGIAFDADGDDLAVSVFQDHDADSVRGWVEFFRIDGEGADARVRRTGKALATPRGAHLLLRVPEAD
jgi:DNA-binding beta-propeller fold protein YncE